MIKQKGSVYRPVLGEPGASKGLFRKGNLSAESTCFVGYQKAEELIFKLCNGINQKLSSANGFIEKLNCSFDAYFDLVNIHSFHDGKGNLRQPYFFAINGQIVLS